MTNDLEIFDRIESNVRSYCRSFPVVFERARGAHLWDVRGDSWIDFFSGAGALNYGHNDPRMKRALLEYLASDAIVHSLDMATRAKGEFLERFDERILRPRALDYVIQFPGPTGTNAVEAALKLARKVTGRTSIVSFTNAFHGMTLGALALTGNDMKRKGAGVPLTLGDTMPYDGFLGPDIDTLDYFEAMLSRPSTGLDQPAAVIVETVQGEGGLHVASDLWLRRLAKLCRRQAMLLIVDDIQAGCGRTGSFFSFERAGIEPDIVCLSKSLSGYGLPMSVVLIRPDLDVWTPGEHNGTFRGNNPAFVTAAAALDYWKDDELSERVARFAQGVTRWIDDHCAKHPGLRATARGIGLIQGIEFPDHGVARAIAWRAFQDGVLLETSGPTSNVLKLMPPLTISESVLEEGLAVVSDAIHSVANDSRPQQQEAR